MDNKTNNGNRKISVSVVTIMLIVAAVSTAQLSSMVITNGNVVYAYSANSNQAASQVINCSGQDESSQNCVNNNLETQGKDNDVNAQNLRHHQDHKGLLDLKDR